MKEMQKMQEGISILKWMEDNICNKCCYYKTVYCTPKIKQEWQDEVVKINLQTYNYSINCFQIAIESIEKTLDDVLSEEEN